MATLDEALAIALDLHTAGRTDEAETLYGRILDAVPDEPNALHLYGLLCAQGGRLDQAADLLGRAVALRAGQPEYRANLAALHQARGNPAAAAQEYRAALRLCPDSAALAFPLAAAARQAGTAGSPWRPTAAPPSSSPTSPSRWPRPESCCATRNGQARPCPPCAAPSGCVPTMERRGITSAWRSSGSGTLRR
ncbi:tetratricopeptide repeat protein [Azospirillum formosense]|uniref:tetratricopeptide repeat protein n=1 Tax=Azospirillum formosense TaxID=861533 RepID=UPI00338F7B24